MAFEVQCDPLKGYKTANNINKYIIIIANSCPITLFAVAPVSAECVAYKTSSH